MSTDTSNLNSGIGTPKIKPTSWPINFNSIRSPPPWLATAATTLVILFVVVLLFLALIAVARLAIDLLGSDPQRASDAVKSLLPIAAAVVGLPLIVWRLVILNQQTRISETKTQIDRETHYTSIFSRSVEQLGQTKEVKEFKESLEDSNSITRTVPNIEVRLGGIHSLSRLADESHRDRKKIENTLLSYVRENSWVDRRGITTARQPIRHPSAWDWQYDFYRGQAAENTLSDYDKWAKATSSIGGEVTAWAAPLPETRVDVSEAVEAVSEIPAYGAGEAGRRFYECLFVGTKFTESRLRRAYFERCTFVRCEFSLSIGSDISFADTQIIDCNFTGPANRVRFFRSDLFSTRLEKLSPCRLILRSCHGQKCSISDVDGCTIDLAHSVLLKFWLSSSADERPSDIILDTSYAALADCTFWKVRLLPNSLLTKTAFAKCKMLSVDLTQMQDLSTVASGVIEADAGTATPLDFPRPTSWPSFDPEFKDEIPF